MNASLPLWWQSYLAHISICEDMSIVLKTGCDATVVRSVLGDVRAYEVHLYACTVPAPRSISDGVVQGGFGFRF